MKTVQLSILANVFHSIAMEQIALALFNGRKLRIMPCISPFCVTMALLEGCQRQVVSAGICHARSETGRMIRPVVSHSCGFHSPLDRPCGNKVSVASGLLLWLIHPDDCHVIRPVVFVPNQFHDPILTSPRPNYDLAASCGLVWLPKRI